MTIRELTKDVHPEVLRLLLLSRHYRSPIDFSTEAVSIARQSLIRFYEMLDRVGRFSTEASQSRLESLVDAFSTEFDEAMCDDFNTAKAIAGLHDLTTEINRTLDQGSQVSRKDKARLKEAVDEVSDVFGILGEEPGEFLEAMKRGSVQITGLSEKEILQLIEERNLARTSRDFKRSDEIRDLLKAKGIQLKDTPEGTVWEKI
jgi:cysteinyl-tRNA synthetase